MWTTHQVQHAVRAALDRQVQEAHQLWRIAIDVNNVVGKFHRMAGGKTNAVDAVNRRHQTQQFSKAAGGTVVVFPAPGVHVLPQQVHFANALRGKLRDFKQDIVCRAAHFFTAGVRHHAVSTVFVAAFHDGDEGGRAISARLWQTVKFLDLREAHVNHRATAAANLINHLWQAVQGLRAKNDIHIGGSLADQLTFLRCDAATHANDQVRIFPFEKLPAA